MNNKDINDILGGEMEQEELDVSQDSVWWEKMKQGYLVPGGIDMDL